MLNRIDRIATILRCAGVLLPNDYTPTWDYKREIDELAAKIDKVLQPRPGTILADLFTRARYAIESGNSDSLHRELLEQVEFLDHEFEAERDRANEHFEARMSAEARVRELESQLPARVLYAPGDDAEALYYGKHASGCVLIDWRPQKPGRHRAIREHAFVQHRGDDKYGCARLEDDDPNVRCGYYRRHHPAMGSNDA
ncbi:hypothetical protein [Mycobacteroides abscessus]|uniref:hypothetical protein n=1 Tax=Mycobacteroides abscessus TaxID=36809 RepID=UPI00092C00F7|nr:hypothetical protein [Mycobacteroides abscessus]MDO3110057.1 hypothetical protein [Mycobacteroides abscessus subsp. abscessus]MDO3336378.1 hypothetical protein [Mycobacteroides abscessus subsp. bolletii]SIK87765.1 Uncharacterised protein [Mycobacteroides abscessus subsp. bolletii]